MVIGTFCVCHSETLRQSMRITGRQTTDNTEEEQGRVVENIVAADLGTRKVAWLCQTFYLGYFYHSLELNIYNCNQTASC